jgi:aspartyl protease family protein
MTATRLFLLTVALAWPTGPWAAQKISLYALFQDKAMILVDGQRHLVTAGGETPEGVKLISTDTEAEEAVVEIGGKREVLKLGVVVDGSGGAPASITLYADTTGFFHADGSINGAPVTFLVDTGANTVALSTDMARRIGIDYAKGQAGVAKTAGGFVRMYAVRLDVVKVGAIQLRNVEAGIIEGSQPDTPLLGMSFLGKLDMRREGQKLELIQRY